jgi:hypothetical protein
MSESQQVPESQVFHETSTEAVNTQSQTPATELPEFNTTAGYIQPQFATACRTVLGAILTCFPVAFFDGLLSAMNNNRELYRSQYRNPRPQVITVYEQVVVPPRKRLPGTLGASHIVRKRRRIKLTNLPFIVPRKSRTVERPFVLNDLLRFLAIVLFSGRFRPPTVVRMFSKNSLFARYPLPQRLMSRGRFRFCMKCIAFDDSFLLDCEQKLSAHWSTVWRPANVVVVDECMNPFKGRSNPHHVHIPRKPHPNGLKVSLSLLIVCPHVINVL